MSIPVLLTGAGFSKNWDGYLAREIWERLLSNPRVRADDNTRRALLAAPEDFEAALATVRAQGGRAAEPLEEALLDVFAEQDRAETRDWVTLLPERFGSFLEAFRDEDGTSRLFSLNQDLFLERNYHPDDQLMAPGIGDIGFESSREPFSKRHQRIVDTEGTGRLKPGSANYVKLHGSFNWRSREGHALVVAGHDKDRQISTRIPLLQSYLNLFRQVCRQADAWLVVAGYSFRDSHINDAIAAGAECGLRLVVLDTQSPDTLRQRMGEKIWSALVGYCSRPLNDILRGDPMADEMLSSWLGTMEGRYP